MTMFTVWPGWPQPDSLETRNIVSKETPGGVLDHVQESGLRECKRSRTGRRPSGADVSHSYLTDWTPPFWGGCQSLLLIAPGRHLGGSQALLLLSAMDAKTNVSRKTASASQDR